MGSKELKFEKVLPIGGVAAFLRDLADHLEGHSGESGFTEEEVRSFSKIKIDLKRQADGIGLAMKTKWEVSDQRPADRGGSKPRESGPKASGKPKYGKLKKRMKKTFEAMGDALKAGLMPAPETVESFLADAGRMVTYPGKGDGYYDAFVKACSAFQEACKHGVPVGAQARYDVLEKVMEECHERFK